MRFAIGALALFLVVGGGAAGAEYQSVGIGDSTCDHFMSMRRAAGAPVDLVFLQWAQGFMSGLDQAALTARKRTKNLASMTSEAKNSFLKDYCEKNPNKFFRDGVMVLFEALEPSPEKKLLAP